MQASAKTIKEAIQAVHRNNQQLRKDSDVGRYWGLRNSLTKQNDRIIGDLRLMLAEVNSCQ